jgi:hypothetical protein
MMCMAVHGDVGKLVWREVLCDVKHNIMSRLISVRTYVRTYERLERMEVTSMQYGKKAGEDGSHFHAIRTEIRGRALCENFIRRDIGEDKFFKQNLVLQGWVIWSGLWKHYQN